MVVGKSQLTRILTVQLNNDKDFHEAVSLVRQNSEGKFWLVGGRIFRGLTHELYGTPAPAPNFDFLIERFVSELRAEGWTREETIFGDPRLHRGPIEVDIFSLTGMVLAGSGRISTIEDYLATVPLTIQSIAYNIDEGVLLGGIGIRSVLDRTVAVLDKEEYHQSAMRHGRIGLDYIYEKTAGLGFKIIYP